MAGPTGVAEPGAAQTVEARPAALGGACDSRPAPQPRSARFPPNQKKLH